jgi:hypothetical protein
MKLLLWRSFLLRGLIRFIAHLLCLYACLAMTLNSMWSDPLFDISVNHLFSGSIRWERVSWGPQPWNIRFKDVKLLDTKQQEVARFSRLVVKDYDLMGLTNRTYGAGYVGLYDGHINLLERPHTEDPTQLIWNIEELFKPKNSLTKPDDGDPSAQVLVQLAHCDLGKVRGRVKMGTIDVNLSGIDIKQGFFEIDTLTKIMRIRVDKLNVRQVDTDIFLRQTDHKMSDLERSRASIKTILSYRITRLQGTQLWWLDDVFGGAKLSLNSYLYDPIRLDNWLLDLAPQGPPHGRGTLHASLRSFERYIQPWGLDQYVRGELKLSGDINGPLDDPSSKGLNVEGQVFVPEIGSIRFQFDGEKSRQGQVKVTQGRVWSMLGDLGVTGDFNLPKQLGTLKLKANELIWSSLASLPPQWSRWEQSAYGEIYIKLRPNYQIPLELTTDHRPFAIGVEMDLSAQGPKRVRLLGRASLTGDRVHLHQSLLEIHNNGDRLYAKPRQTLRAHGRLNLSTQNVTGKLSLKGKITPNSLPPLKLPLTAQLGLTLKVEGHLLKPRLQGQLKASKLTSNFANYPWRVNLLNMTFTLDQQHLKLSKSLIKTPKGAAYFAVSLPFNEPLNATGWAKLNQLKVDLNPLDIPLDGLVEGVICTHKDSGCAQLKRYAPLNGHVASDSCLSSLYDKDLSSDVRAEACLSISKLNLKEVNFREFELNASISPKLIKIRRGRLWKSRRLLLDFQGQIDEPLKKTPTLNASLKLIDLPLQLLQKFVKEPPLSLKTLYGTVAGDFNFKGSLAHPEGDGKVSLTRLSTRLDLGDRDPVQLSFGHANLNVNFFKERISAQGHLGKQFWIDSEFVINKKLLSIGLDLHALGVSLLYAPTNGEKSYHDELKQIKTAFEQSLMGKIGITPVSIANPNRALQVLGLGDHVYCDWVERQLPLGQIIRLGMQGRAQLNLDLTGRISPKLDIDIEDTRIDYWLRDIGGEVIRHEDSSTCIDRCIPYRTSKKQNSDSSAYCPSLSMYTPSSYHIEISGKRYLGETVWVNPSRRWHRNLSAHTHTIINEPTDKSSICPRLSFIGNHPQEEVRLMPVRLESGGQELELKFGMTDGIAQGCLSGQLKLNILTPFLRDIFQQVNGSLLLDTSFRGPLSALALEGEAYAQKIDFISPRTKLLGDIHLAQPVWFTLKGLKTGGTQISLKKGEKVTLKRNEGELSITDLKVQLPKFILHKLSVGFSAPQFEMMLPQMMRASLSLRGMRFIMNLPSQEQQTTLSADAPLKESQPYLTLSGNVRAIRAVYHADFLSIDKNFYQGGLNLLSGRTAVETMSIFEKIPLLKKLYLDLRVQGDNEILVKSQIADLTKLDLELNFDLKVRGKLISERGDDVQDRLTLSGYIDALEGSTLTISKNPFEITHAKVLFGGGVGDDAQTRDFLFADLIATHTFRIPPTGLNNRQINFDQTLSTDLVDDEVTLTSQLKMPTQESLFQVDFDLRSQSGRSRIEILNLVLFGSYPTGLSVLNNTQPATGLLLSPVLNFIERPIADSLGLDNLSLTPDSSSLFIDVDKVFSRRLRFNLRTQIGEIDPNTPQSIFLEYKINNLFSGEITAEQRGDISTGSGRLRLRLSWD